MKSVLISIRPKWCEKIAIGEKTMEIRKTRPKLDTPFKVYIYCTAGRGKNTFNVPISRELILQDYIETGSMDCLNCNIGNEKVIGEFICDAILSHCEMANADIAEAQSCLRREKILEYSGGHEVYGWHISDLKIYATPKELSEFSFPQEKYCEKGLCGGCPYDQVADVNGEYAFDCEWKRPITKPPQSWCYVEGEE